MPQRLLLHSVGLISASPLFMPLPSTYQEASSNTYTSPNFFPKICGHGLAKPVTCSLKPRAPNYSVTKKREHTLYLPERMVRIREERRSKSETREREGKKKKEQSLSK